MSSEGKASDGREQSRDVSLPPRTVIKQETSDVAIHCGSASLSTVFPDSQMCVKQEGSTIRMRNNSLQGKLTLPDTILDVNMHLADAAVLPFPVKEEPASDDENWEQKGSHIGDDPLGIQIKQEITFEEHLVDLMEDEVNAKKEIEEESGSETDTADESSLYDDSAVVKSENGVPDRDISEEKSMFDATEDTDKQQLCDGDNNNKSRVFHKHIKMLYHADSAGYKCSICGKIFSKSQACLLHIWHMHTGNKHHACKLCGKAYKSLRLLKCHNCYSCDISAKDFKTATALKEHEKCSCLDEKHHLCEKTFKMRKHLHRYKQTCQSNKRPHSCDVCGKAVRTNFLLKRHKVSHSDERPYCCELCGKTYKFKNHLNEHKRSCHSNKRSHSCDVCGKAFKTNYHLIRHKARHSDERPCSCEVCGKTLKTRYDLHKHKWLYHSNKRPYSCDVCGKAFRANSLLKNHKVSHSDERPYCCELCGKTYKFKNHLNEHRRICHSNKKSYSCDVCGKAFKTLAQVERHKAVYHSSEKPYVCELCEKAFKREGTLLNHRQMYHSDEGPFSCYVNGKTFKQCSDMKQHKASHVERSQSNEGLCLEDGENTVKPLDTTKIIFTYSKLTNLCRKQQLNK